MYISKTSDLRLQQIEARIAALEELVTLMGRTLINDHTRADPLSTELCNAVNHAGHSRAKQKLASLAKTILRP